MKRSTLMLAGIALMVTAATSGCCGWHGAAYRGGCSTGACSPGGGPAVIPQGAYYQSYDSVQTAHMPVPVPDPIASAPVYRQSNYRPVAQAPLNPLPTY